MVTLELHALDWNTKYIQYDPTKWVVRIVHHKGGLDVEAMSYNAERTHSYGYFDIVDIRTSPIPEYVSKHDILIWD